MNEKATIYEVARLSGFSTATVSRVIHDGVGFSENTRKTVLESAAALGWIPNYSARSLARRRAGLVGLLFPDFGAEGTADDESPLFVDQVIRGAERAATLAGDAIVIGATRGRTGGELARSLVGKVDGLIVLSGSLVTKELAEISARVPVVVLASHLTRNKLDFVEADNRGGAVAVTCHLLEEHGLTDLAFVAGPAHSPDSMVRFAGFVNALKVAGLATPRTAEVHGGFTEAGGARAVGELLDARTTVPQAIVFGNDEMAIGGLATIRARGLRVPDDIAITGFDDIASARHVDPTLTTVRQPMRDIGATAVRTLLRRIAEPGAPRHTVMLPTSLVVRASCGCTDLSGVAR
ncbi:MAG: LacI family DNA-binding transcriptional regulator [Nocardioides sp.]